MHLQSIHIIFLGKSMTYTILCTLLFLNLIINFGDDSTSELKAPPDSFKTSFHYITGKVNRHSERRRSVMGW